ncbi:phBC6A51 family helix-turn-helix protein [Metabacillus idriensis]|uniref:phBC6A51 family helix-turn-helix protein n=1 Tax=Metabacillus idriensis TaxID=324768 RepID=UPI00174D80AE|nr:phBC6A51 family helix-turn-helix protein [Metabacillus idriensis]
MNNLTFDQLEVQISGIQKKAAWLLVNGDIGTIGGAKPKTYEEIAQDCGIDARTLYNWWTKDAKFIAYMNAISYRVTDSFQSEADAMLRRLCLEGGVNGLGSIKALELYYKRMGLLVNKSEVTNTDTINREYRPLTDDEVAEKIREMKARLQ